jgi:type IV secretion system protein VirD4
MSGSVSRSKNDPSQSLQMTERPLMSADELKTMKKGRFVVMKTGVNPMISRLKLFFKWGIAFDEKSPYSLPDRGGRTVHYTSRARIEDAVMRKYPVAYPTDLDEDGEVDAGAGGMAMSKADRPGKVGNRLKT